MVWSKTVAAYPSCKVLCCTSLLFCKKKICIPTLINSSLRIGWKFPFPVRWLSTLTVKNAPFRRPRPWILFHEMEPLKCIDRYSIETQQWNRPSHVVQQDWTSDIEGVDGPSLDTELASICSLNPQFRFNCSWLQRLFMQMKMCNSPIISFSPDSRG